MGAGAERGGGAPARVQPDQAAPAQVQRALPRRQVVPVAGGDGQRGDSPPSRGARRQAEGHALFRSLRARLCHPRDARPAAAHLPHAHLLARGVRPPAPARPPVHLVRHQQVLGTVRRPHHAGGAPRDRGRVHLLHGGPQPAGAAAARGGDAGGGPARLRGRQGRGAGHRGAGGHVRAAALRRAAGRGAARGAAAGPPGGGGRAAPVALAPPRPAGKRAGRPPGRAGCGRSGRGGAGLPTGGGGRLRAGPAGDAQAGPPQVRLSSEPDRGRRRAASARRRHGGPGAGRAHRPRGDRPGQTDGGGLRAGLARPGGAAPRQRGAVPAAAGPRRGAPLRHRLPPQAARQVDDPQRARRHPRRGRGQAQGPGAPLRLAAEGRAGQRGRDRRPARLRPAPGQDGVGPPPRSVLVTQDLHTKDRLRASMVDFVVITGMSGAGRSEAAKVLEDLGYFVIDNLPPSLIGRVAELALVGRDRSRVALVVDARGGAFADDVSELQRALEPLRAQTITVRVVFLEASDEVLVRRYEQTRRRHPVAGERVVEAIARERELLRELRASADLVIDTSDLNVHELRNRILAAFADEAAGMLVTVSSFGFKYGLPLDADVVLDVRFLPNPHWLPSLRPKTGQDRAVRDYVLAQDGTRAFMERVEALLEIALPGYVREGKHYLTVAIGCTGGRHRSVVLADELGRWLGERSFRVNVTHRDMERE